MRKWMMVSLCGLVGVPIGFGLFLVLWSPAGGAEYLTALAAVLLFAAILASHGVGYFKFVASLCPRCERSFVGGVLHALLAMRLFPPRKCYHCGLPYGAPNDPDAGKGDRD